MLPHEEQSGRFLNRPQQAYPAATVATAGGRTVIALHSPPESDALSNFATHLRGSEGFVVIDAGAVFDRVCATLGAHPNKVLDAAYPEDAR